MKQNSLCPIYVKNKDGSYDLCGKYHSRKVSIDEVHKMQKEVIESINKRYLNSKNFEQNANQDKNINIDSIDWSIKTYN